MKKIENTKISYNKVHNSKEVSIPLIWIVLPLIILVIFFPFNISAKGSEKNTTNELQSESIKENVIKSENNILSIEPNNTEKIEEKEEIKSEEDKNSETVIRDNTNVKNSNKIYTASNGETYSIIGILDIPSLNIKYGILSTSSTALLKISLNRYWGAYPNEVGNMVVVGHNYKNNKFFSNLSKINIDDIVKITDNSGQTLDYVVYDTDVIDPYDNTCTSQLTDGRKEITLITCYYENGNIHATKRFVVKARAS